MENLAVLRSLGVRQPQALVRLRDQTTRVGTQNFGVRISNFFFASEGNNSIFVLGVTLLPEGLSGSITSRVARLPPIVSRFSAWLPSCA